MQIFKFTVLASVLCAVTAAVIPKRVSDSPRFQSRNSVKLTPKRGVRCRLSLARYGFIDYGARVSPSLQGFVSASRVVFMLNLTFEHVRRTLSITRSVWVMFIDHRARFSPTLPQLLTPKRVVRRVIDARPLTPTPILTYLARLMVMSVTWYGFIDYGTPFSPSLQGFVSASRVTADPDPHRPIQDDLVGDAVNNVAVSDSPKSEKLTPKYVLIARILRVTCSNPLLQLGAGGGLLGGDVSDFADRQNSEHDSVMRFYTRGSEAFSEPLDLETFQQPASSGFFLPHPVLDGLRNRASDSADVKTCTLTTFLKLLLLSKRLILGVSQPGTTESPYDKRLDQIGSPHRLQVTFKVVLNGGNLLGDEPAPGKSADEGQG
ncbi:hypothetical protein DFH06DRAFT_1151875 [Mycena polygramma]|nr:hypothetical protein DFH06DRAFT_1152014 [Mycena polygramma]KAJ7603475.1 hypothetical protein DFH06DRAFT_1151875 [Mycena polygramma]